MNKTERQINELLQKVQKKQITIEEFKEKLNELGAEIKIWDKSIERNPAYPEGNNQSRTSFIFSPYFHPRGMLLQRVFKRSILKVIDFVHKSLVKEYDSQAYVYEDERLRNLNNYFREYISANFIAHKQNTEFMTKIADIIMFLMKEDVYYRSRFLDLLNNAPHSELTDIERENISRWH